MQNLAAEFAQVDVLKITALEMELESLQAENLHLYNRILALEVSDREVKYVGSVLRNRFHRPSCEYAESISPHNRVAWVSREAAIRAGRKPCMTCGA